MPTTLEAIIILVLLVVPGFLCWQLISSRMPSTFVSDAHSVLTFLFFSTLIHVLASPVTICLSSQIVAFSSSLKSIDANNQVFWDWAVFAWVIFVLFVMPIVVAWFVSWLWKKNRLQWILGKFGLSLVQKTPKAWDWFFLTHNKEGYWVVAEMDDGALVGGEFGGESFSSLSPHKEDLYLESAYYVDENHIFLGLIPNNAGVWINGDKVKALFFYSVSKGD